MRLSLLIFLIGATGALARDGNGVVAISNLSLPHLPLGLVTLPNGKAINVNVGAGAGAYRTPGDAPRRIWTITDRGPSIDCTSESHALGAKLCPPGRRGRVFLLPGYSPSIYAVEVNETSGRFAEMVTLKGASGKPLTGLINPPALKRDEASFAPDGRALDPDPSGIEPGGLVRRADGTFFIADGYGPSIVEAGPDGAVRRRIVPEGLAETYRDADYPILASLPAGLAERGFGRGFAAIGLTPDERRLYVALQAPAEASGQEGTVAILAVDPVTGAVAASHAYPLDPLPQAGGGRLGESRIVEMTALDDRTLLVLERQQGRAKIYRVGLGPETAGGGPLAVQDKTLLFTTEGWPGLFGRLTGMAMTSDTELVLTSSELGMEGMRTQLFRLTFARPLTN